MEREITNNDYSSIKNLKELRYHRRILTSRIEHQEIMISYKIRTIREYISPMRLLYLGCETMASQHPVFNIIFRAFNLVKSFMGR